MYYVINKGNIVVDTIYTDTSIVEISNIKRDITTILYKYINTYSTYSIECKENCCVDGMLTYPLQSYTIHINLYDSDNNMEGFIRFPNFHGIEPIPPL